MAANNIYLQVTFNSDSAQANVNALNEAIGQTGKVADESSKKSKTAMQSLNLQVQQTAQSFDQLGAALAGLGIARAVQSMIQVGSELARAQQAMALFTGSAEEGRKVFEQVRAVAAQSPFELKGLEQAARQMLGFGIAAQKVPGMLKAISDQVAAMGGSIDDVSAVVRIFGRVMEKDFVSAMDLTRILPKQGVAVMKAMREEIEKELKRPVSTEVVEQIMKEQLLKPEQTLDLMTNAMRKATAGFGANLKDPEMAFKQLGDAIIMAKKELVGENGFGPALANLARVIRDDLLAPALALARYFEGLPDWMKNAIVEIVAATAAFTAMSWALKLLKPGIAIVVDLAGAVKSLTVAAAEFVASQPELAVAIIGIGAALYLSYKYIAPFREKVDESKKWLKDQALGLAGVSQSVQKAREDLTKAGTGIPSTARGTPGLKGFFGEPLGEEGGILDTTKKMEELTTEMQKRAVEANKSLLEAFTSPVEAVQIKYAELFKELDDKMTALTADQQKQLRGILEGAKSADLDAAFLKQAKQREDEQQKYQIEKIKMTTDAQVEYIQAADAQDLRTKVANLDKIAQLRIQASQQVADMEQRRADQDYQDFVTTVEKKRAYLESQQVDVDQMEKRHADAVELQKKTIQAKATDDQQKYLLDSWKRTNDLIIEDQKRIYESFKSGFDEIFDAFTDKTKNVGQALGDVFKNLFLGEAKNLFSSSLAGFATQAAGYGYPEDAQIGRGGILGTLLMRGMPPRPPLPPPRQLDVPQAQSDFVPSTGEANREMDDSANLIASASNLYDDATVRFAMAVGQFSTATVQHAAVVSSQGEAARSMDEASGDVSDAIRQASAATGASQPLLRAIATVESGMRPGLTSPKGAQGLFQLMPATQRQWGITNPFDPYQSAMGGAQQIQWLLNRYGGDPSKALAAYNYGPGNYDKAMAYGRQLPPETVNYVRAVQSLLQGGGQGGADLGGGEAAARPFQMPPAIAIPPQALLPLAPAIAFSSPGFAMPALGSAPDLGPGPVTPTQLANAQKASIVAQMAGVLGLGRNGQGSQTQMAQLMKIANLANFKSLFGINAVGAGLPVPQGTPGLTGVFGEPLGAGTTSLKSILTSRGAEGLAGAAATFGGMALLTRGLQQHYAPAAAIGGGLAGAGMVLTSPQMMARFASMPGGVGAGIGAGAAAGVGLGLFASGFQRGGGTGVAMDIGGGALAGAGIGFMAGGPLGAAIGAGVGAVAGAITGIVRLFVATEQEKIRSQIKQVYGIDISNRQILTQVQQIVDQNYGGNVAVGIRSNEVQNLVRLYALSTGQAANMPRPMYAATIAQGTQGLQLQPVYQGGVQVQNPYTGVTTYQYQTAVAAAGGLLPGYQAGSGMGVPGAQGLINQQWSQLTLQTIQGNPSSIAMANASAVTAGDSRLTTTAAMNEPLTALS